MNRGSKTIHCDDAIAWLKNHTILSDSSLIASLPDKSEFPKYTLQEWKEWFTNTAQLIFQKTPDEGLTLFYQSDIKFEGVWVDKSFLIMKAAEKENSELLFHKILCRTKPGILTFGRPAYSHLIAFSKKTRLELNQVTIPDVLPDLGEKTWERGMGLIACLKIASFLKDHTSTKTLINPFCGEGSILAAAQLRGLDVIGIERSPKRVRAAENLKINQDETDWVNQKGQH